MPMDVEMLNRPLIPNGVISDCCKSAMHYCASPGARCRFSPSNGKSVHDSPSNSPYRGYVLRSVVTEHKTSDAALSIVRASLTADYLGGSPCIRCLLKCPASFTADYLGGSPCICNTQLVAALEVSLWQKKRCKKHTRVPLVPSERSRNHSGDDYYGAAWEKSGPKGPSES